MNTSATLLEAEKLIVSCGERKVDCIQCKAQNECAREWDRFIETGTDGVNVRTPQYARFRRRLAEIQQRNAVSITGVFVSCAGLVLYTACFWGDVLAAL